MYGLHRCVRIPLLIGAFLLAVVAISAAADHFDTPWSAGVATLLCVLILAPLANTIFAQYGPLWLLATGTICGALLLWVLRL